MKYRTLTASQGADLRHHKRGLQAYFECAIRAVPRAMVCAAFFVAMLFVQTAVAQVVVGSQQIQPQVDSNTAGTAEAFKTTATASGSLVSLTVYIDSGSTATKFVVGLYADAAGKPGSLLTQGTLTSPTAGAWNAVNVQTVNVTSAASYWIAVLGPVGAGTLKFRDKTTGTRAETSAQTNLTGLPATWTTGGVYGDAPLSAYGTASGSTQPILAVAPSSLTFSYTQGAANPSPASLNVTNTGTGVLNFTASGNTSWLSVSPLSGTAPQSEQVTALASGLSPGTYNGQVTVSANGAQGSPAVIPVTLSVSAPPSQPVLSVTPASLNFSYTLGGVNPPPAQLNITNTGTGSLSFTASGNASWISVSPSAGTAPQNEQVTASPAGMSAGTYSGQVTITASGAQGSPAAVPVTLTINSPPPPSTAGADWPMVNRDPTRSGFAANDSAITKANVSSLGLTWTASVDGKVVAQPLYMSAVQVGGQVRDVVIAATTQNSLYALDAGSGAQLWRRNFGADFGGCQPPGGSGIRSAPVIDRNSGRIYFVSDDGALRTISLSNGADAAATLPIVDLPATNKIRGGLNLFGGNLYIASGSGGCDAPPWRGRIYRVDVSGAAPVLATTFDVIPSLTGDNRGGGIWGYGGVAIDSATGEVFAATGADRNETYTPYGVRMLSLTANLVVQGSYEPPHPSSYPCSGAPCDVDFGATPIVFQPTGCPTLVAAGNKSGDLYLLRTADLAASRTPLQSLKVNPANDWLGSGGLGGVPAYWPDGRMLFVTDAGSGVTGIAGGIIGLSVQPAPACTLQVVWSAALPNLGYAMSSPTVAGGVVFVGEGGSGLMHAYDAATGSELWNSGSIIAGGTYAAPSIGGGKLYVASWNGQSAADSGTIRAFASGATPPPPPGPCSGTQPVVLLGDQAIGSQVDYAPLGTAEAFQTTASGCGTVASITLYLDASSTAGKLTVGLYANNGAHPGSLLGQGSSTQLSPGSWNKISVTPVSVTSGSKYWIAILGTQSGSARFRDRKGGCSSETSGGTSLATLPPVWTTGQVWDDCPISGYGSSTP